MSNDLGLCPTCGKNDGYFNCGPGHWFVCHEHRTRWFVGSNLFSSWREQTEEDQRHSYDVDPGWGHYTILEPPPSGEPPRRHLTLVSDRPAA